MTIKPEEKDSKDGKDIENMTAQELSNRIGDLMIESSGAFRNGRDEIKVAKIDVEIARCHDKFEKLTGKKWQEWTPEE